MNALLQHLRAQHASVELVVARTFTEYLKLIGREKFELLIVDLVVPQYDLTKEPIEMTSQIIEVTRGDYQCLNFRTPALVLTSFDEKAEENFRDLNGFDFGVVTFSNDNCNWSEALDRKIRNLPPNRHFDFVIVCALTKEAMGYADAGFDVKPPETISGLHCRPISIAGRSGVIVTAPRMGLVSCAITTTLAIGLFSPQLVCMSGICGGVPDATEIYDVVIAETCHQHDVGKWAQDVFKPEVYSIAIDHQLAQKIRGKLESPGFVEDIKSGITLRANEFPQGVNDFRAKVYLAPASSGSAVIADGKVVAQILGAQRKNAIFEMESYALYEAARLSLTSPVYFSAKSVVDDGGPNKGDHFHRVGCLLSAKVVVKLVICFDFV